MTKLIKGSLRGLRQSPSYELRDPRYGELTTSMAEYKGLAFVTFAKNGKITKLIKKR